MKIRQIKSLEQRKENEFIIDGDNKGLLAVTVDLEYIFQLTASYFRLSIEDMKQKDEINTFVTSNINKVIKIFSEEIQDSLDTLFTVFCTLNDSLFKVKLFFAIFGKRIERLINLLILCNFRKRVLSSFYANKKKINKEQ